ncbi:hypothetical protein M6D93_14615 [Jatrophihabitans telluris]|uniref:Acyl carrier protein n=1 Tax=Jatrophihabitans telluris TaxID=2038343 RepID=A0ABY4QX96_9ACTN|nr:hypothetical protein [Jatrophihabitans telluris]UQX87525.1 hypothetical protein M6D93_14615 [Jatrophihabitans telluris]
MVHTAPIRCLAELALQAVDRAVEGLVEIGCAGLSAHDRPAGPAGDLDALANLGLPWILLVQELYIGSQYPIVVPFDAGKFLGDMLTVMIRDLDITAPDDDLHATS